MFKPKPGFRLELHIVKSHGASRLNRDGADRPKTMEMGAVLRLRTSSQGEKYSLRHSEIFGQFLCESNKKYGTTRMVRTRKVAKSVKTILQHEINSLHHSPDDYNEQIDTALVSLPALFATQNKDASDTREQMQLISLSEAEIEFIAKSMLFVGDDNEIVIKDCAGSIKEINKERNSVGRLSPELQLFGRFTTASVYLKNIDCPLQVSHGFTVHKAQVEQDYWTAVDDLNTLNDKQGSAHIGMRSFGAGVFYHYYCLDVPLLSRNICAAHPDLDLSQKIELTQDVIAALLYAALTRNPTGGQSGHANHSLPSFCYLTYGNAFPYDASSAFESPVQPGKSGGYLEETRTRFTQWLTERKKRYGIFSGFENGMGLEMFNSDLKSLIESGVYEATPDITQVMHKA